MEKLSVSLSHNILSRLPLVSLFNCKQVCKAWYALVTHPDLPYLHRVYHEYRNDPFFILHSAHSHGDRLYLVNNFGYVYDDLRLHSKGLVKEIDLPDDQNFHKFTSVLHCDGFLCLSYMEVENLCTYSKSFVFNLFAGEWTKLPPRPMTAEFKAVSGFGFHPESKERKVVKIVEHECVIYNSKLQSCELCLEQSTEIFTLGSSSWRLKGNNPFRVNMQSCQVLVNGVLHWLGQEKVTESQIIVSFDLMLEEFYQISLPNIRIDGIEADNNQLAVLDGCLSVVSRMKENKIDIWVMKDCGIKETWTKGFTIEPELELLGFLRPLWVLRNGEILAEYAEQALFSYDRYSKKLRKISVRNLPRSFQVAPSYQKKQVTF